MQNPLNETVFEEHIAKYLANISPKFQKYPHNTGFTDGLWQEGASGVMYISQQEYIAEQPSNIPQEKRH